MSQDGSDHTNSNETRKSPRACLECRRKKTRCDMRRPICGLCSRTQGSCTFPTKRKTPQRRRQENQIDSKKLERLVSLLESRLSEGQDIEMLLSQTEQLPRVNDLHTPNSPEDRQMRDDCNDESQSEIIVMDTSIISDYSTSPASTFRSTDGDTSYWLAAPSEVLTALVNIFFSKIQGWLPLLHRPRFFSAFMKNDVFDKRSHSNTEALLLCGMFALAARHSKNTWFQGTQAPDRGQAFVEQANTYYEKCQSDQGPTIDYLQGCILLAAYEYASAPSHRAWILAGVCVRLAYDLNLCNIDEQDDSRDWSLLEEQRRAFWIAWELDSFGSNISKRPSAINRSMMIVKLPVGDEAWFSNQVVDSPVVDPRPSEAWKILLNSPNQDPRAWFLVANILLSVLSEFAAGRFTCQQDKEELIDIITCFSIVVSQRFSLESLELSSSDNAARHNWIIGIHLMLTCARTTIQTSFKAQRPEMLSLPRHLSRIFYHWYPDYIPLSQPFLACCLLSDRAYPSKETADAPYTGYHNNELVNVVLSQYASVWNLASIVIDLRASMMRGDNDSMFEKRFALFFPSRVTTTNSHSQKNDRSRLLEAFSGDEIGGSNKDSEEQGSRCGDLQHLVQANEMGDSDALMTELVNVSARGLPGYMQEECSQSWNPGLSIDYLGDEHQHLNCLQL
ncbi:fungal-specific transcription factor domain-containing protein [Fusarium sp. MPI-SDFR-AT-0072]|nr:fungal-specific transcription factor domain-containing protein [Fusarium sp. MPI-SDFR-AT-0072]